MSALRCDGLDFASRRRNIVATMAKPLRSFFTAVVALALSLIPAGTLAEHHETWIAIAAPHFTVLSNAGESEGRKTALQLEEIRALFHFLYPKFRVDPGKQIVVFAIKNEDSLKLFIPTYGQNNKGMHIGGFYHLAYDKNFAVIRTDVRGDGPLGFHTLYHEYTHAFFRANFRGLPLWLDEGLAEYFGNTSIESKEARVGEAGENELRTLKSTPLLPIEQLLTIDGTSPLYNTRDHAGIFYAESWALVHYLNISAEMRDKDLLNKYLHALHDTDDPIEAAKQTFGDLKQFSQKLDLYIHNLSFFYQRVPLQSKLSEKDFPAHTLSPTQGLLAQADYLIRSNHLPEGLELLHEVEKIDPATPGYHAELGHYHLAKADYANAEKELQLAIAANPNDFSAHVDLASLYYRRDGYSKTAVPRMRAELEKVLVINPDFAPSLAFLSMAYIQEPDKDTAKALKAAQRAADLERGTLAYYINIGRVQLAAGQIADAKKVAEIAQRVATTAGDRTQAANFAKQIDYKLNHPQETTIARNSDADSAGPDSTSAKAAENPLQAEGQITELLCGKPPEVLLTLTTGSDALLLHVTDLAKITLEDAANTGDASKIPCAKWKDRRAKVTYRTNSSGMAPGEVQAIALE